MFRGIDILNHYLSEIFNLKENKDRLKHINNLILFC